MKALITGASSGIGKDMAKYLSKLGYDLVIVARRRELLEELSKELNTKVEIEVCDVSIPSNCEALFEKHKDIDILVNNAGFGTFGNFVETDLNTELNMVNTNIVGLHVLTKLYLKEMVKRDNGHILNVGSLAGFMPGPLMATYYASKNYVVALSRGINKELSKMGSKVRISVLCPGPVDTNFNNVAGVKFGIKPLTSEYVAKYGIDGMFKNKEILIPGFSNKLARLFSKILPWKILSNFVYNTQRSKNA